MTVARRIIFIFFEWLSRKISKIVMAATKPSYSELQEKVKFLEKELAGHRSIEKLLWEKQDQLFKVLDSLEAIVYVADMQSYEILFANLHTEKLFGHITGKDLLAGFADRHDGSRVLFVPTKNL